MPFTTTRKIGRPRSRWVGAAVVAALVAAGCGGGDDDASESGATTASTEAPAPTDPPPTDPPATDPPATTAAPTTAPPTTAQPTTAPPTTAPPTTTPPTTLPSAPELPDTPATAAIETTYDFGGGVPDPELLPVQPGEVTAKWYRAGATYALVYEGLPPDAPACPGNSAQTTAGFDFVSNAPLPGSDCGDFPTAIESNATQGVQVCGDRVSYLTLIPADMIAVLYSSIERPIDGGGVGLTGFYLVEDPTAIPEIDPALLTC